MSEFLSYVNFNPSGFEMFTFGVWDPEYGSHSIVAWSKALNMVRGRCNCGKVWEKTMFELWAYDEDSLNKSIKSFLTSHG